MTAAGWQMPVSYWTVGGSFYSTGPLGRQRCLVRQLAQANCRSIGRTPEVNIVSFDASYSVAPGLGSGRKHCTLIEATNTQTVPRLFP